MEEFEEVLVKELRNLDDHPFFVQDKLIEMARIWWDNDWDALYMDHGIAVKIEHQVHSLNPCEVPNVGGL